MLPDEDSQQTTRLHELGIPLADLEHLGQLFMRAKVSQLLASEDTVDAMDRKSKTEYEKLQQEPPYVSGTGVDLISVPLDFGRRLDGVREISAKTAAAAVERLDRWGVAVLQSALPQETCRTLARALFAAIKAPTYPFGNIIKPQKRKDYPLEINSMSSPFLEEAVRLIMPALKLAVGADAELVELSALMSMPGASAQSFHSDATMSKKRHLQAWAKVYSVFIYLDDVDPNMAPLDLMPATHTHYHFLAEGEREMLESVPFVRMSVPCGTMVIMDSRIVHRGSENSSPKARPTFYFSVMAKGGDPPEGPTYSIREGYKHKFTVEGIDKGNTLRIAGQLSHAPLANFDAAKAALEMKADLTLPENYYEETRLKAAFALSESSRTMGTAADNSALAHPVMKPPVVAISTSNYTEEIQKHAYTFVCFFDPRSAAYKLNKKEFEKAAQAVKEESSSKTWHKIDLSFAAVNAARDSFLTNQEASELDTADQAPVSRQHRASAKFEFGFPNFTPIIFLLFANGVRLREYQGVVESSEILRWLQRMVVSSGVSGDVSGGRSSRHSAAAVAAKRSQGTMFAVLCAPIASTSVAADGSGVIVPAESSDLRSALAEPSDGGDDDYSKRDDQGTIPGKERGKDVIDGGRIVVPAVSKEAAFRNLSSSRPDLIDFVVLDSEASCKSTIGPGASYGDVYFVHKKFIEPANWTLVESFTHLNKSIATAVYRDLLESFLTTVQAGSKVQQLTPDNSHVFLDRVQPVIIALFHPDPAEKEENERLKRVLLKAVAALGRSNLQLTWADGKEFGPQFDVASDTKTLPTLLLVDTLTNPEEDTIQRYSAVDGTALTVANIKKWLNTTGAIDLLKQTTQLYWSTFTTSLSQLQNKSDSESMNSTKNASDLIATELEHNVSTAANTKATSLLSNANAARKSSVKAWFDYTKHLEMLLRYSNHAQRRINEGGKSDYHGQQEDIKILLSKATTLFGDAHHKYPLFNLLVNTTAELEAIMADNVAKHDFRRKIEAASQQTALLAKGSSLADEIVEAFAWLKTEMGVLLQGEEDRFAARKTSDGDESASETAGMDAASGGGAAGSHVPESVVQPITIDRRDWKSLSLQEFYTNYALPKIPVVITNLKTSAVPWTLDHFRETCGNEYAALKMRDENTTNWGGLVDAEVMNIGEFINTHATNDTRRTYYLHDWSLPRNCPKMFGPAPYTEFLMPK